MRLSVFIYSYAQGVNREGVIGIFDAYSIRFHNISKLEPRQIFISADLPWWNVLYYFKNVAIS